MKIVIELDKSQKIKNGDDKSTESRMYTDWAQLLVLVLYLNLTGGTVGRVAVARAARAPHSSREELQVNTALLVSTGRKVPHSSRVEELLLARALLLSTLHQPRYARIAENIVKIKRNLGATKEFIKNSGAVKSVGKWLQGQPASRIIS